MSTLWKSKTGLQLLGLKEEAWYLFGQRCNPRVFTQFNKQAYTGTQWLECIWVHSVASAVALSEEAELCLNVRMYFSSVSLTQGSTTAACFGIHA